MTDSSPTAEMTGSGGGGRRGQGRQTAAPYDRLATIFAAEVDRDLSSRAPPHGCASKSESERSTHRHLPAAMLRREEWPRVGIDGDKMGDPRFGARDFNKWETRRDWRPERQPVRGGSLIQGGFHPGGGHGGERQGFVDRASSSHQGAAGRGGGQGFVDRRSSYQQGFEDRSRLNWHSKQNQSREVQSHQSIGSSSQGHGGGQGFVERGSSYQQGFEDRSRLNWHPKQNQSREVQSHQSIGSGEVKD